MNLITIKKADYLTDYKINFQFNDGSQQIVDFKGYFKKHKHPQTDKYKDKKLFKTFKIDNADTIFWGQNWDLCFNSTNLYYNDLDGFYDNYERGFDSFLLVN